MGESARTRAAVDDVPVVDPEVIQRAYRLERARRRARLERQRARRLAGFRFAASLLILLGLALALGITIWREVQRLFGL